MALKSVSISRHERLQIANKIKEQYIKLAKLKHPDPDFHINLSKKLYVERAIALAEQVNEEAIPYMQYTRNKEFPETVARVRLRDIEINTLDLELRFDNDLLSSTSSLAGFEHDSVTIPSVFDRAKKQNLMPLAFSLWDDNNFPRKLTIIDPEIKASIDEYNQKMTDVYTELSSQLNLLLTKVEACKSTKMFEAQLPNLVSLYPASVEKKLQEKNNTSEQELTEEEQRILDATASLAAAALLEDK